MNQSFVIKSLGAAGFAVALMTASGTVSAQSEDQIKDLLACDKIKKAEDKLECFNAVIEILKAQEAQKSRSTAEGADSDLMRRRSVDSAAPRTNDFGFSAAEVERRDTQSGKRSKGPKEQTFTFSRAWRDAVGKYYFLMTNGQVWKEVGGSHLVIPKRAKKIRIKRNMFGGYSAFVEGMNGRRGKVKRIR